MCSLLFCMTAGGGWIYVPYSRRKNGERDEGMEYVLFIFWYDSNGVVLIYMYNVVAGRKEEEEERGRWKKNDKMFGLPCYIPNAPFPIPRIHLVMSMPHIRKDHIYTHRHIYFVSYPDRRVAITSRERRRKETSSSMPQGGKEEMQKKKSDEARQSR